ncbi:MAG: LysR substrate-binding domain-containing protein [Candidatus Devosia phytovorans]|uniref:LysR substrate-binding domain-containing protein n=1 Tax=Candidatus Devosia phytovorans TaxID=3121372 RepID=A0AAJ6AZX6_9HYPH|nr:LysR substrate-binding domain-containing protein [Devosia sp.]WEK02933.1 MAG: LysR substrate-binding domain-containing protein [Devosia sp.]
MLPLMDKAGLELSLLSKFVLACQSPRLADAAKRLDQSAPALSMALHGLEEKLGLKLFVRRAGGLDLLPSAFWLFRVGTQLLYLEEIARKARPLQGARQVKLTVDLELNFAIGRVSRALLRTCQDLIVSHPELMVEWRFAGFDSNDAGDPIGLSASEPLPEQQGYIRLFYANRTKAPAAAIPLYDDPWIVVGSPGSRVGETVETDQLTMLRMRPEITDVMLAFAHGRGFAHQLQFRDEEPAQLADILREHPHLRLLMPSNLLPIRLGLARHEVVPFNPRFVSSIYGQLSGSAADYGNVFLAALQRQLAEEGTIAFTPRLTTRQIHYFNLAAHTGSISAAARVANTAQSSVSKNISQMEDVMGGALLRRTEEGATLSPLGEMVRGLTNGIEERQDWIIRKAHDIAAHSEARVTIGTLPSSGHDSALTERIAEVVTRIHARHPDWQLQVVESSNTVLHERVRAGDLNLAIVGVVNTQVARIRLGPMEPLAVIAHPLVNLGGRKEFRLEDVVALPLVLGRHHLSIHQSFADAAHQRSLRLKPVVEVGSLALAISMVRKAPLCTILPASSVRQDIEAGNLQMVPIRQDELSSALSLIFSAERELSEAERAIVQEFTRVFRPGHQAEPVETAQVAEKTI